MGRIKTQLVKTVTNELFALHKDEFTRDFTENKLLVNRFQNGASKKIRNTIAGYVTRLKKTIVE